MSGFAGTILALILIGAVVGGGLALGAPVLAIPIAAAILVIWGGARLAVRRGRTGGIGEERAADEAIEFDERDRRTLTPSTASEQSRS